MSIIFLLNYKNQTLFIYIMKISFFIIHWFIHLLVIHKTSRKRKKRKFTINYNCENLPTCIIFFLFQKKIWTNPRIIKLDYFKFLFINIIYKSTHKKFIMVIFDYEIFVEKSIIEILSSKFMLLTLNIHSLKITRLKINVFLTIINLYNLFFNLHS